ncbi:hypothetical protein, partial [Actinoplanes sp. TFC3]|uniref:hypothetical protein n=1 Tax=Actinoplanes sp. TFC3 TaxID=1710355 RepID=UPI001F1E16DD
MQGSPAPVPDWPETDAPLPEDEPTAELPLIEARDKPDPTSCNGPTLARAALDLALSNHKPPRSPGTTKAPQPSA